MITWMLESGLVPKVHERLEAAIRNAGQDVMYWKDDFWDRGLPALNEPVMFHGSLGNASKIAEDDTWTPGAFCNTSAFRSTDWYPSARNFLLHDRWRSLPAKELVENRDMIFEELDLGESAFIRPDSPLKPFSGRVVHKADLTLAALDHGFYYDDEMLQVVVAPVQDVRREWRYIVYGNDVIAGSAYQVMGRKSLPDDPTGSPWKFAEKVAAFLTGPDPLYILDVCEASYKLRLLELNPFSGADLYACHLGPVVEAVTKILT